MPISKINKTPTQTFKIPCMYMRGGTSKGPFLLRDDLPEDEETMDKVLLCIMGSPHPLQIDGLGGGRGQTSKLAIVSKSDHPDADVDYLFSQVGIEESIVDKNPNCGNMLSAVGPFAIEKNLVEVQEGITTVRIRNVNTDSLIDSEVQTPNKQVNYIGDAEINGVPGSSAPIYLNFFNAEGAKTGELFPTGETTESIDGINVTLVDYSVPMMLLSAESLGLSGQETAEEIDINSPLLSKIELMRLEAGKRMGLGDVSEMVIPKVAILSKPKDDSLLTSRYLMPWNCHKSHAITGAMCITSSCFIEGTITTDLIGKKLSGSQNISIEHPTGHIDLKINFDNSSAKSSGKTMIHSMGVLRTARKIFAGDVFVDI